jgi:subtilisin family serine protease
MRQLAALIVILLTVNVSFAKEGFVVRLEQNASPLLFAKYNNVTLKPISKGLNLYLATPNSNTSVSKALFLAKSSPSVKYASPNHKVTPRSNNKLIPNDKQFDQQWGYNLDATTFGIDATTAWAVYGTGGLDRKGNEIVIAVVDGGFDITHPDIANNIWVNKGEIPGNNIDDDGNGYIDDVNGWDVESNTGTIQVDYHGTHVTGTMGAEGNNGINGSGVNWKIKIMVVSAGWELADTETTLSGYEYIRKQKELWIQSGGTKGANVVAINSSFGIDQADCTKGEFIQWNEMFDYLGQSGILSIAATANADWDIDTMGDVPTGCTSDYVVAVTNSKVDGEKDEWAGYGIKSVDLAAPGTDVFSIYPGNTFDSSSGTSMATPHVTGSVGYLYSVASLDFLELAQKDPARAAVEMKEYMLLTVSERPSMKGKNVSGGIMNLFNASTELANFTAQISGRELILSCTK